MNIDKIFEELHAINTRIRADEAKFGLMIENYLIPALGAALKDGGHKTFTWTQWAPAFNDGDLCILHIDDESFTIDDDIDPFELPDGDLKSLSRALIGYSEYFLETYHDNHKFTIDSNGKFTQEYFEAPY